MSHPYILVGRLLLLRGDLLPLMSRRVSLLGKGPVALPGQRAGFACSDEAAGVIGSTPTPPPKRSNLPGVEQRN